MFGDSLFEWCTMLILDKLSVLWTVCPCFFHIHDKKKILLVYYIFSIGENLINFMFADSPFHRWKILIQNKPFCTNKSLSLFFFINDKRKSWWLNLDFPLWSEKKHYFRVRRLSSSAVVLTFAGNLEHLEARKINFGIRVCCRSQQMPYTDQIIHFILHVRLSL